MHACYSEFERSACGLLTEMYKHDKQKSKLLLMRPLETWNNTTVFKLAANSDSVEVKTHILLQTKLDNMWHRSLKNIAVWKVSYYKRKR